MKELNAKYGHNFTIDSRMSSALGLPTVTLHELVYDNKKKDPNAMPHVFAPAPDGGAIFVTMTQGDIRIYRLDKDQNLMTAIKDQQGNISGVPLAEAEQMLHDELLVWANLIGSADEKKQQP